MEIRINKEAQEKQQKEELNRVIVRAKTYANAGVEFFEFKRQRGIGLSAYELIEMVEKETNETVYGGTKCVSGDHIRFSIRNWNMYSIDCSYYTREFNTLDELVDDVITSGMDPNYEVTFNGEGTGEDLCELIVL